jgi:hypothetical protein
MAHYHNRQPGYVTAVSMLAGAGLAAAIIALEPVSPGRFLLAAIAVGTLALAVLFSSLTVALDACELRWHFGPGLWRYRLARSDITTVRVVRTKWWYGFGIGKGRRFCLYNVSGLEAVELTLRNGEVRCIGSNDAAALAAALAA